MNQLLQTSSLNLSQQHSSHPSSLQATSKTMHSQSMCNICLSSMENSFYLLNSCSHSFHHKCLQLHCLVSIEKASFPIKCPQSSCLKQILVSDLSQLLTKSQLDKFYHFSLKHYVRSDQIIGCPTPGCENYVFEEEEDKLQCLQCEVCNKKWCMKCIDPWHARRLKLNQTMDKMTRLLRNYRITYDSRVVQNAERCYSITQVSETMSQGCEILSCPCGHNFCFKCKGSHSEHHKAYMNKLQFIDPEKYKQIARAEEKEERDYWRSKIKKSKVRPVPKYPPPPKSYVKFLKKKEEDKMLQEKVKQNHLLLRPHLFEFQQIK